MKTLISLAMATFVLGLIYSADLVSTETWEKVLIAKGWENVTLENWADTTWYGKMMDVRQKDFDYIRYISPDGRKLIHVNRTIGSKSSVRKFGWELERNGKYCIVRTARDGRHYDRQCGKTIWKKEKSYIVVSLYGNVVSRWTIIKGNPEKF